MLKRIVCNNCVFQHIRPVIIKKKSVYYLLVYANLIIRYDHNIIASVSAYDRVLTVVEIAMNCGPAYIQTVLRAGCVVRRRQHTVLDAAFSLVYFGHANLTAHPILNKKHA